MIHKIKSVIKQILGLDRNTINGLKRRGVTIGSNCSINTNYIDDGHGFMISIGNNVTIAVNAVILAHDASTKPFLGYSKVGRVEIGNDVFIGGNAIVLPNVKIGNNVIIGAGTVVNKDIPSNSVAVGNPVRIIGSVDNYIEKNKALMKISPIYNTYWKKKSKAEKIQMKNEISIGNIGFDI